MNIHTVLLILSSAMAICAAIPYQLDIAKGKVKPRIVTWLIWALLSGIAAFAAIVSGHVYTAIFILSTSLQCLIVVLLGFKAGSREVGRLDVFCFFAALVGIFLLVIVKSPELAVVTAIITDIIGTIPTVKHCWQKPYEESLNTFIMFVISEWLILFTVDYSAFTSFAYPLFYLLEDSTLTLFVLLSPHQKTKSDNATVELSKT